MKILFIVNNYPSTNEVGGLVFHQQAQELKKRGFEIKVICLTPWVPFPIKYFKKRWKKYSDIPKKTNWEGIEVFYPRYIQIPKELDFMSFYFAFLGERIYKRIKNLIRELYRDFKFDVIHAHHAFLPGYAGMKIAQEYKKPLVVTIHGGDFYETIFRNEKLKNHIEKVLNFSTKIIVVSNKLKEIGERKLKISPDKFVMISNGINQEEVFKGKTNLLRKYKDKKIILSVSFLIKRKAIDFNLRAIAKLKEKYPDLLYLIIGDGAERKKLEKLAKKLKIDNYVKFLGQLPNNKVKEYMSICNIFCLPSYNEAFGMVYAEAMASGKPVIGCWGEGCEDFVKNRETGILVKPQNVNSLVEAIDLLLSNPRRAEEIGERAKRLILENYTYDKVIKKLIGVYNQIITMNSEKC